ncbi:MAG: conjugal transfer protein TraN, partial [Sulfurimonas sp.]|nr:conjugal transfer protein TraN [Sulfurimonas sp.]
MSIPNTAAENDFIASLILGNQFAWIGVYDPSLSNNYCYETGSCSYDDSRFKTIQNQSLSYKNWDVGQPDNLLITSDIGQIVDISPLGEHWAALNSVNYKWYDFGNHNDEYNNPVKFSAVYEFDSKPECFKDDNSNELVDLHCNTAVSSTNGLTSDSGVLQKCSVDEKGTPYCPAALAQCQNTQNSNDGFSTEHTGTITTRDSLKCPSGGTLSGTTCNKTCQGTPTYSCLSGGTLSGTTCNKTCQGTPTYSCPNNMTLNTTYNYCYVPGLTMYKSGYTVGLYQSVLARKPDVGGYNNWSSALSSPPTKANVYDFINAARVNGERICGRTITAGKQVDISVMYVWYLGRCPDNGGWSNWNAGSNWNETEFLNVAKVECPSCPKPPFLDNTCPTGTSYSSVYSTCTTTPTSSSSSYACNYAATATTSSYACNYAATCPTGTKLPTDCSGSFPKTWIKDMYTTLLSRCPDQAGYNHWLNYINTLGITSSSQLQPTFCTAAARNNEPCGSANPSATTCYGTDFYKYYTYDCNSDTNIYNESYIVQNSGGLSSTNPNPPTNNCVQQDYTCGSNPDQTCAKVDGVWKCSEHPCVDANDMEHTDTEVGSQDGDDDGWNKNTGACEGQLYLFGGTSGACRSWDLFGNFVTGTAVVGSAGIVAALDDSNCCSDDAVLFGLISCKAEEKLLAQKKKSKNCHDIGEFCSKKIRLGFAKICVQKKKSSCCFNSKLARIINEQGRPQLNKGWGSASNPECKG